MIKHKLPPAKMFLMLLIMFSMNMPVAVFSQAVDKSDPSPLKFPTPKGISNQLFYLQRDPNINTIIYELNMNKNGEVNREEPVLVYWMRYADNNEKKDLNYIQRKFAYGVVSKELGKDYFELKFVSHTKLPLYLVKSDTDKKFHVYVTVNKTKILLSKIFVRIEGGSFWLPNVKYVELKGINSETNAPVLERIKV